MKVGLVGFGMVAEGAYLNALSRLSVQLHAIADTSRERRAAASRALPGVRTYENHADLLAAEKELDALIVTTPPSFHADAVLAGLKSGLHVLCEKPLTFDPAAFAAIRDASRTHERAVYCVNNWAYSPQWMRLFEIVSSGTLGAVRHAEIVVTRQRPSISALPNDWRKDPELSGGGILVDHGWHALYLMRRLLGVRVSLTTALLTPSGPVDTVATVLLSAPGAGGVLHLSWTAPRRENTVFVVGDRGTAQLCDDELAIRSDGRQETVRFAEKLSAGSVHPDWLAAMWPAFLAECSGRQRGENLDDAAFCLQTIRAAYGHTEVAHV